jgi:hypothetical protein
LRGLDTARLAKSEKTAWQRSKRPHTFTVRLLDGGVSKWSKDVDCKSIRLLPFTGSTPVSTTNLRLDRVKVKIALQRFSEGGLFYSLILMPVARFPMGLDERASRFDRFTGRRPASNLHAAIATEIALAKTN